MDSPGSITYFLPCKPGAVYVNVTDRCLNNCLFCIRRNGPRFFGHDLTSGEHGPEPRRIVAELQAIAAWDSVREVVFCGMGEPLLRYDCVLDVCIALRKLRGRELKTRVDTSGLFWATNPRLDVLDWIDVLSISLNAENAEKYEALCRPTIPNAYKTLKKFLKATQAEERKRRHTGQTFPEVRLSVVDTSEEDFVPDSGRRVYATGAFPVPDLTKCGKIAEAFGWPLVVKKLFRDSQDPRWEDRSFEDACARGIEQDSCRDCPHRH